MSQDFDEFILKQLHTSVPTLIFHIVVKWPIYTVVR